MKYCPECGFELKPGDEFCINCGAVIDEHNEAAPEPKAEKKSFFKTPGGIILIVFVSLIAIVAIAGLILINTPQLKVLRAAYNTAKDISETDTAKIYSNVMNGGSVEADAELKNIVEGFSIPFLSQVDATAGIKYYMNAEEDSYQMSITGALGGTDAVSLDAWVNPHRVIVKSPTLIGKNAYGIDMSDDESRAKSEKLVSEYLGVDVEEYDRYLKLNDAYAKNKDVLNKKLGYRLYVEAFKNGSVEKGKDEITIADEAQKTETVFLTLTGDQIAKIFRDTYTELKDDEDFAEVMACIDRDELFEEIDKIPADYRITFRFFINKQIRLIRFEVKTDDGTAVAMVGPDPAQLKEVSLSFSADGLKTAFKYHIDEDSESEYLAHISAEITEANVFGVDVTEYIEGMNELTADLQWNKTRGDWTLGSNCDLTVNGEMLYADKEARGLIRDVSLGEMKISPQIRFVVKEEDKMPSEPQFTSVKSESDLDAFISDVTGSIEEIKEKIFGNIVNSALGALGGLLVPEEEPAPAEEPAAEPESDAASGADTEEIIKSIEGLIGAMSEEANPETGEDGQSDEDSEEAETGLSIGGIDISGLDLNTIQQLLKMFGINIDINGMNLGDIQKIIDSLGLDNLDIDTVRYFLSMLGIDPSIVQPVTKAPKKAENSNKEIKKEQDTESSKDDIIKKDELVTTEGKYLYDDGNKFAVDPDTGAVTYHVVCSAELKKDNTYSLKYSDGMFNYEDKGTFKRYADDTMEFTSETGIDATGKYYPDHLNVTIPGFGSINIPKKQ